MKINVYYGGRGLLDDPTLYVLGKMEDVLRDIRMRLQLFPEQLRMLMELFLPQRWSGLELADICSSFSMHAGYTVTKKKSVQHTCSQ